MVNALATSINWSAARRTTRHLARALAMTCLVFPCVSIAGTPVYLRLESRFPSGTHPRTWLESRTKENQVQRWFRVKSGETYGWLAEDHVITQLKLSSIARANREEPDRSAPSLDALRGRRITKGSQIIILEIVGSWARVRVLGDDSINQDSWILTEALSRDRGQQIERGFASRHTPLRAVPQLKTGQIDTIDRYHEISVLRRSQGWLEIQVDAGTAWIERKDVWLAEDFADGSLRPFAAGLELRSAPLPYANVVTRLKGDEKLKVLSTAYLRWGHVKIPEHGWLWWPISDQPEDGEKSLPPVQLSTKDLVERKIYDMAASESVPGLRLASAKGVFVTRDGQKWSMIPRFEDKNYPIVIAKGGPLFVGPYVSNDNGENFEQWIRWDRLVETIKLGTGLPPQKLRLSSLESSDREGRKLSATFDVGRPAPLLVETVDRGQSWVLKR